MNHLLRAGARIGIVAEGRHDHGVLADWVRRILRPDSIVRPEDCRELGPKPKLQRQAPAVADLLLGEGFAPFSR